MKKWNDWVSREEFPRLFAPSLAIPWGGYAVLVSSNGTIMALPPQGEHDFGLKELTKHSYQQAITKEIFKPEAFNLYKRDGTADLSMRLLKNTNGVMQLKLNGENKRHCCK